MDKELKDFLDKKFSRVDEKFDQIDKRFDGIDKKFVQVDERFDGIDKKIIQVDEKIDKKAGEVLHRFQIIAENLDDKIRQVAEGVVNLNQYCPVKN